MVSEFTQQVDTTHAPNRNEKDQDVNSVEAETDDSSSTQPMLQETSITWELIAESSKNETTAVYDMIMKRFADLKKTDIGTEATNAMKSSYLTYPPEDINSLLDMTKVHRIVRHYELDVMPPSAQEEGTSANKKKGNKKGKVKGGCGGKKVSVSARDQIRFQQTKEAAQQAKDMFGKKERGGIARRFQQQGGGGCPVVLSACGSPQSQEQGTWDVYRCGSVSVSSSGLLRKQGTPDSAEIVRSLSGTH